MRSTVKRILFACVAILGALAVVLLARTWAFESRQLTPEAGTPLTLNEARVVEHLRQALRIETISRENPARTPGEAFRAFHAFLTKAFPKVHASLKRETVSEHSLLYTWPGTDDRAKPILLLAHMDVVPVAAPEAWTHPPFSGALADGFIWGRGALDDKSSVLGILEAVEALLAARFRPGPTIYLAFGHDEEVSGQHGAVKIAALLKSRGVRASVCLDEGLAIVDGVVPGISKPVALIGIAEKGYLSVTLTARGQGGHSSQPPRQTALGILGSAVAKLESHPLPGRLGGPVRQMFDVLGPEMTFGMRMALANLWLFGGLVERELAASPTTDAALRTTTAVTMMNGGTKDNVLPASGRAVVNFRIMPGETIDSVMKYVRDTIGDERVEVAVLGAASEPSPVSAVDSAGYVTLNKTIRQVYKGVLVAPALDLGATDSRHYVDVADDVYRFAPLWMTEGDLARIHGANERIGKDDYLRCVQFFAQFIRNAAS